MPLLKNNTLISDTWITAGAEDQLPEAGDVIDATSVAVPSVDPLNELLTQYSADAIMAANDGKIPASDDEIAAVRAKLENIS